jgi:hypothetical protein
MQCHVLYNVLAFMVLRILCCSLFIDRAAPVIISQKIFSSLLLRECACLRVGNDAQLHIKPIFS